MFFVKARRTRRGRLTAAVATALLTATLVTPGAANAAGAFVSDDFSAPALASRWQLVTPLGVGSATVTGSGTADARLALSVPAGTIHNPWRAKDAVRVVQAVADSDYGIEAKFDSMPSQAMQSQGLMFEAADNSFVRYEVHHTGTELRLFASTTINGTPKTRFNVALPALSQIYLRAARTGDVWTLSWSEAGTSWTAGGTFSQSITIANVGPFVGTYHDSGNPPAYTALVDYVFDTATPIVPEDGDAGPPPPADTTPPVISDVMASAASNSAQVSWTTDEATTGTVEYGTSTTYGTSASNTEAGTDHGIVLAGLSPGTTYHYRVVATDGSGNTTTGDDATFTTVTTGSLVSDDFSAPSLAAHWQVVRPLGVGSATVSGSGTSDARLSLAVPAGASHDPWKKNDAVRAVQSVINSDFSVEAKFDSMPVQGYQSQGLTVEETDTSFLRYEVHHNGSQVRLFASTTINGTPKSRINLALPALTQVYLRIDRIADAWTLLWSADGTNWSTGGAFSQPLTVAKVGPFVGNYDSDGDAPAYTALVDYVFDPAAPIVPEDGFEGPPPPTDTTPPTISGVAVNASTNSAQISWATSEAATGRVEYGLTTAYGSTSSNTVAGTSHSIILSGLLADTTYHYRVVATDEAGNIATGDDATFTTQLNNSGPVIDVWYGASQTFGAPKHAQDWANLVGNVSDPDGVVSLHYQLNGGPVRQLSIGPDKRRLQWPGDFNADIRFSDLAAGENTVLLTATDGRGALTQTSVTVVRSTSAPAALPHTVTWSATSLVAEQAQVVDGKWRMTEDGLRTEITGYDRIVALGDVGWSDYEVTVPVTVHAFGPAAYSHLSGAPLIGLGLRWHGHSAVGDDQPAWDWFPTGAFAWYRFYEGGGKFELRGNQNSPVTYTRPAFQIGTTYNLKVRVETLASATRYQVKVWAAGSAEPAGWLTSIDVTAGPSDGGIALIAHQLDGTFGDVTVTPI